MARNAKVVDAFGQVEKKAGASWKKISVGDVLAEGAVLRTGAGGAALLLLQDGHRVRVGEKTTVTLTKLGEGKNYALNVAAGQVWSLVRKASQPASFRVETPSAVAGVTGTLFGVALDEDTGETVVDTNEGSVEVSAVGPDASDRVPVRAGQFTRVPGIKLRKGGIPRFGTQPHNAACKAAWQQLHSEGSWARQDGRGSFRMQRGREDRLHHWWHGGAKRGMSGRGREPIFKRGRN